MNLILFLPHPLPSCNAHLPFWPWNTSERWDIHCPRPLLLPSSWNTYVTGDTWVNISHHRWKLQIEDGREKKKDPGFLICFWIHPCILDYTLLDLCVWEKYVSAKLKPLFYNLQPKLSLMFTVGQVEDTTESFLTKQNSTKPFLSTFLA